MSENTIQKNKERVWDYWIQLDEASREERASLHEEFLSSDVTWFGPHPINSITGNKAVEFCFYQPLYSAFPDLRRTTHIFFGGSFNGGEWISATGYLSGTFQKDWLGIPASGETNHIRFGEFSRLEDGRIVETRILFDLVDLIRQGGRRVLPESRGKEGLVSGPKAGDGVLLSPQSQGATQKSIDLVEGMIHGLGSYENSDLNSMGMERFWDTDSMVWYGPTGIGTTYGLEGFQKHHQKPFLRAFPDRKGGNHVARIAEGNYVASTGWPSVLATHKGEYLGTPPSEQQIGMRVMDWWRREGDLLEENWVFIDLPHLFLQFGVDLLAQFND